MLHGNKKKQLSRERNQRNALIKSLVVSLVKHEKMTTGTIKAKVLKPYVEKLITTAKAGTITSRRLITARIGNPKSVKKLVEVIAPKYKTRAGGYTRVTKLPHREGDGSSMATIEFV